MSGFFSSILVTGRKAYRCEHCRRSISTGTAHNKIAHRLAGRFDAYREHVECRAAWVAVRTRRGLAFDQPTPFLCADGRLFDDRDWLELAFPVVARRLWPVRIVAPPDTREQARAGKAQAFRDHLFPSIFPGDRR